MATFEDIFSGNEVEWISALPAYHQKTVYALFSQGKSYDEIAITWLQVSGPSDTFPFGTQKGSRIFFDNLVEEIEKFLCQEDSYIEERKKLLASAATTKTFVISSISTAVAPTLHVATPLVIPVVALILITITKFGRNAWCSMRREQKVEQSKDTDT